MAHSRTKLLAFFRPEFIALSPKTKSVTLEASREWFKHNEGILFEAAIADLGFTMEEVRNYEEPS